MARGRTQTVLVTRWDGVEARRGPDELIVEEPLAIQLDGHLVATTMRTPGHDYELAAGYCLSEGLLGGQPVETVRYCATGSALDTDFNVVTVETGGRAPVPTPRLTPITSSCGLCGSAELDVLLERLAPLPVGLPRFSAAQLASLAESALPGQPLFSTTGAVHGAVALTVDGEVIVAREDVGRHNAVDKVIGRLLLDERLPAHDLTLAVTSRASFEIVQKAWSAGFAAVVAVSAPTALAVTAARLAGMTLAGFARPGRLNVYAPERLPD
jgi:FdhD protein